MRPPSTDSCVDLQRCQTQRDESALGVLVIGNINVEGRTHLTKPASTQSLKYVGAPFSPLKGLTIIRLEAEKTVAGG